MPSISCIEGDLTSHSLLKAALAWAALDISVLLCFGVDDDGRCDCGNPDCSSPGKHPIAEFFSHGHQSATTDADIIRRAVRKNLNANLAIVPAGDVIVLDVDGEIGQHTFAELALPPTATVLTSRGLHAYYRKEGSFPLPLPKLAGIDVKSRGTGYILVPPSVHASGHQYTWESTPKSIASLRHEQIASDRRAPPKPQSAKTLLVSKGNRNTTLTSFAGYLRYRGLADAQLKRVLETLNGAICDPPIDNRELEQICRSIGRYPTDHEEAFGDLADVVEQEIKWLAHPYFVRGAVNVIEGNPGDGKSTFVVALAAAASSHSELPWVNDLESGRVLVLSAEDDPARVLKPRFIAHGANLSLVRFQKKLFTLDTNGLGLLRSEIEAHRPRLVIIDPLIAYMDASVDLHRANETMQFMNELDQLAREFDTTILVVRHLRKGDSNDALYRGLGSIAIAARVRSILLLGRHPDDPDVRAVAHVKSNYAPFGPTILFDLNAAGTDRPPRIRWLGIDEELGPEHLLNRPPRERGRPDDVREEAKELLRDLLSDGEKLKSQIEAAAEARAISQMTLRRAAEDLGVRKYKKDRRSYWTLPTPGTCSKFA
jgi:Bifunctional DNA primase/polymerase, N-terminal/AAA domain/Primase C terminal 1 (PriCT-1)